MLPPRRPLVQRFLVGVPHARGKRRRVRPRSMVRGRVRREISDWRHQFAAMALTAASTGRQYGPTGRAPAMVASLRQALRHRRGWPR